MNIENKNAKTVKVMYIDILICAWWLYRLNQHYDYIPTKVIIVCVVLHKMSW